jgi:xylulose-5-phosphate/fructose-6-phosphate phosphoketolase
MNEPLSEVPSVAPLSETELALFNRWWHAANYLSVGQIYLMANPLREPLQLEHTKPRLLGHWGTTPGLNFLWLHLNRIIRARETSVLFIAGPGHGAPGLIASTYLEGTYSEYFPEVSQDLDGLGRLMKQFSFPGGIPSHAAATTPGSIHEGGELGYSLSHAYGAAFDNPDLVVACVIGDGEAETGPLATSWHSNKFVDPATDGAVLPILHLNGYKIANPTILARIAPRNWRRCCVATAMIRFSSKGMTPTRCTRRWRRPWIWRSTALPPSRRRRGGRQDGAPRLADDRAAQPQGLDRAEGDRRAADRRLLAFASGAVLRPDASGASSGVGDLVAQLPAGRSVRRVRSVVPRDRGPRPSGTLRMSANPHANGGQLKRPLRLPDIADYAVAVTSPGHETGESTRVMGEWLRDVMKLNLEARNFRVLSPDENNSNRLNAVLDVTNRAWNAETFDYDDHLARDGHVMEILSEHTCQGWLEGYLLTGGTASCPATRRSSTSSIRWSTSMPNG